MGYILPRNELAAHEVHTTPLDLIGADTQGSRGYMSAQTLENEFQRRGIRQPIAAVVTQVLVDRDDPGFQNPTKKTGPPVCWPRNRGPTSFSSPLPPRRWPSTLTSRTNSGWIG